MPRKVVKATKQLKAPRVAFDAPLNEVRQTIHLLRGQRIILDTDLARLYGVTTARLKQQVRRNIERFPNDFMFPLTWEETDSLRMQIATLKIPGIDLRSQIAASNRGRHGKYVPFAFTEHGAIMAASVLNSKQAVQASLFVVRAFVQLRELLSTHRDLADKLDELERRLQTHDTSIHDHGEKIAGIIDALRNFLNGDDADEDPPRIPIGFHTEIDPPVKSKSNRRLAKKT